MAKFETKLGQTRYEIPQSFRNSKALAGLVDSLQPIINRHTNTVLYDLDVTKHVLTLTGYASVIKKIENSVFPNFKKVKDATKENSKNNNSIYISFEYKIYFLVV